MIIWSKNDVELERSPVNPAWVREGTPTARKVELSRSADGTASTLVWDCTEGKFDWFYDFDETVYVIEGSVVIEGAGMPPTRFGPGDVIFFPKGAQARWHVEGYVRKVAFCRHVQPRVVGLALRVLSRLKRMATRSPSTGAPSLGGFDGEVAERAQG